MRNRRSSTMSEPESPSGQIDNPDAERPSDVTNVETPAQPEVDSETRAEADEPKADDDKAPAEPGTPDSILPEGATVDADGDDTE